MLALVKMCEELMTIPKDGIPAVFSNTGIELGITVDFVKWVKENYERECSPEGDFAEDMIYDKDFPGLAEHDVIRYYLDDIGACSEAISVFEELWKEYERARG